MTVSRKRQASRALLPTTIDVANSAFEVGVHAAAMASTTAVKVHADKEASPKHVMRITEANDRLVEDEVMAIDILTGAALVTGLVVGYSTYASILNLERAGGIAAAGLDAGA